MGGCGIACLPATNLEGRAKWDAWNKQKALSKVEAMKGCLHRAEALMQESS